MNQLAQMHPVIIAFLFIMLVALYVDQRRVMKQNREWYKTYIISKVDYTSILGMAILEGLKQGVSVDKIIEQLKQVNEDNSEALSRIYGEWYNDLKKFL